MDIIVNCRWVLVKFASKLLGTPCRRRLFLTGAAGGVRPIPDETQTDLRDGKSPRIKTVYSPSGPSTDTRNVRYRYV